MKNVLLSFIIPVYNVEQYLQECVRSIISQYIEGCEIILVDDGSTDASGRICDELAAEKEYITVIHQENAGVSAARNIGLKIAAGEYITFVDSDDRIAEDSISEMITWIKNEDADLCFLSGIKFYPDGTQEPIGDGIIRKDIKNRKKRDVLEYLSTRPKFPGSPCTKIYRKAYLEKNGIVFPNDRRMCEDLGFCRDVILNAETYDALDIPYYEYRQNREGSRTDIFSERAFFGMGLFVKESVEKLTDKQKPIEDMAGYAMSFAAYEYCIMLWRYHHLQKIQKKEAFLFLEEYAWVLQFGRTRKIKMIRIAKKILGTKIVAKLLDCYMNYK